MTDSNNKRIAKNTLMLYFRMIVIILTSLYVARVVLNVLGVQDFGIHNIVGGVVIMLSFISSSMSSATQRFLTFELGANKNKFNLIYSMSINIYILLALIILFLAETVGLWFVNYKLNIPVDRMEAANWVYQFSILSFVTTMLTVTHNAAIITYEKMSFYAYLSMIEAFSKLGIVFILLYYFDNGDKLILYAGLLFLVNLLIRGCFVLFARQKLANCKYSFLWDKQIFKTLLSYAGWNLWGSIASIGMREGLNILLNIFFGVFVNAARAIAQQVNSAVFAFVSNIQLALSPQIVKNYANNNLHYMHDLIYKGAKISFFLLLIITMPILVETEEVLTIWLNQVPEYTVLFVQLTIINSLIDSISLVLRTGAQASGNIKLYQTIVGCLLLCILPISYFLLKIGYPAETAFYINIIVSFIALFIRLLIVSPLIKLKVSSFLYNVLFPILKVSIAVILLYLLSGYFELKLHFLLNLVITFLVVITLVYLIGINKNEKEYLFKLLKK